MGAWGYEALESDSGLDVVDFLGDYIASNYKENDVHLKLSEVIAEMKKNDFIGDTYENIDFFYDNSVMALCELYLMFKTSRMIIYEDDEDQSRDLKKRVKSFEGDKESIKYLVQYLKNIDNEVPDEDGEREIAVLWKESDSWDEWKSHLNSLITNMEKEA